MHKKYLSLTTTLPYVNSAPHVGFALEIVQADVVARFKKSTGYDVFLILEQTNMGLKINKKAKNKTKTHKITLMNTQRNLIN